MTVTRSAAGPVAAVEGVAGQGATPLRPPRLRSLLVSLLKHARIALFSLSGIEGWDRGSVTGCD